MGRVIGLLADGVNTPKSRRNGILYNNLGQVQIQVDGCNLFQVVIKPVAIKDAIFIKERLRDPERRHRVSFGLVHLLVKSSQLCRQVHIRLLCLFSTTSLLLEQDKLGH